MSNARDIIKAALRTLGVYQAGETPPPEELTDGLSALNMMLQGWSAEGLLIPHRTREELSFSSSAISYTIGSGGALDTTRPMQIFDAIIRDGTTDYPLRRMTQREFTGIADKTVTYRPTRYYYEPDDPLGIIYFDAKPSTSHTLILASLKPLTTFANLDTDESLPDEYIPAMKFNLAVDLASEYERDPPAAVVARARKTLRNVIEQNAKHRIPTLWTDESLRGATDNYNIISDGYS